MAWIQLDLEEFNFEQQIKVRGTEVTVYASPYDVPHAVRGISNSTAKKHIIEFAYSGGAEPWRLEDGSEVVQFRVGRNSARIYGIEIVQSLGSLASFVKTIEKAIQAFAKRFTHSSNRDDNYQIVTKIIDKHQDALVKGFDDDSFTEN